MHSSSIPRSGLCDRPWRAGRPAGPRPAPGSQGAAFFDLDRTLLRGASGEVFSDAMRAAGLVSRTIPGEKALYHLSSDPWENTNLLAGEPSAAELATAERLSAKVSELWKSETRD